MVDHFCRSTQKWRQVLAYVQTGNTAITKSWLLENNIEGINAWDFSTMVESFLVDYFPRSMYNRRVQLSGGEMGNGFEMWRRLFSDFQSGSTAVECGGVRRLQEFPKCTSLSKLSEHLDDWTDVLTAYGSELEHCPRLLRNMVLNIIPKNLEDEILDEGDDQSSALIRTSSYGARGKSSLFALKNSQTSRGNHKVLPVSTRCDRLTMSPIRAQLTTLHHSCHGKG